MPLMRIVLTLARTKENPEGNPRCGYEFVAPLDGEGHLDPIQWVENRAECKVRRFWDGERDQHGYLIHTRRGAWAFSYAVGEDDDEPIFRFEQHRMAPGEYVSITEHDGATQPFRVASVDLQ